MSIFHLTNPNLIKGASRGNGKGIALQLGQAGAIVYITGRTMHTDQPGRGSLEETANEIKKRGGTCIPVQVDHEKDEQTKELFQRIDKEQNGRLDILVNNAFKAVQMVLELKDKKFWEMKPETWDEYNNVGLRNHYFCTVYAARMMIPRKSGLIVFISSIGGTRYAFNALNGIGKAAIDRMATDCGAELKDHNVACISLVLGPVHTELMDSMISRMDDKELIFNDPIMHCKVDAELMKEFMELAETNEFAGKCIIELALDANIMKKSSKVIEAAEYAQHHNIRDVNNRVIPSYRQINYCLLFVLPKKLHFIREFVPDFIKVPKMLFSYMNDKLY